MELCKFGICIVNMKVKYLFISFIYALIFSSFLFFFTVDKVVPRVAYKNVIEFDLAYLNYDDVVCFHALQRKDNATAQVSRLFIEKSDTLKKYHQYLPYEYAPFFRMAFGEDHQIEFAISNLKVNSNIVPLEKIASSLINVGYTVRQSDNVLYVENNSAFGALDLYVIAKDDFVFMTSDEVNKNIDEDSQLRRLFFVFLVVINFLLFRLVKFNATINLLSYLLLSVLALILVNSTVQYEWYVKLFFIIKNNFVIIIFPLLMFILSVKTNKKTRWIMYVISIAFFIFIGIDHFVQNIFGTRFLYESVGTFAGAVSDGLPFLVSYILSYSGFYYVCSLIVFSLLYWSNFDSNPFVNVRISLIWIVFLLSFSLVFCANTDKSKLLYNTFQVNANGWFTDGNNNRNYEKFKVYDISDLDYKSYKGLNLKKNVIVILVESLSCEVTFLCGDQNDYLPNLKQVAYDNVFFSSYFSNNTNTNGAIFTITTGFPFISGPNSKKTYTNDLFYKNDLINKFHQNGYLTSYYSPATFVLGKKNQLLLSNYDYLSSADDNYYDEIIKPGVFGSVSDEEMFNKIVKDLQKLQKQPVFIMLTTVSTHTPYLTPWGYNSIERAFAYSDYTIVKFIQDLNSIDYFKSGIVLITGDHRNWGSNDNDISSKVKSRISREQIPLIMIDGNNHNVVWNKSSFSHSSLAVLLEYMMLPTYEKNKFQVNPILDEENETILYQNLNNINQVVVKKGIKEDFITLDGDQTRFEGSSFSAREQQQILGYISWLKR